jgi:hypothetical protein
MLKKSREPEQERSDRTGIARITIHGVIIIVVTRVATVPERTKRTHGPTGTERTGTD